MLVEISSYPKCGNTWVRYIIANYFSVDIHTGVPDVHQQKQNTATLIQYATINGQAVGFYKSHVTDCRMMEPDRILCIYRHPLDVFLSSLNYFFVTAREDMFHQGVPVPVETLLENGKLNDYFAEFLDQVGTNYYTGLLGSKSNYFEYLFSAFSNSKVVGMKYEDLCDSPSDAMRKAMTTVFDYDFGPIGDKVFEDVNNKTKDTKNPFYWQSRKENYTAYLSQEQVDVFTHRYQNELNWLGY